MENAIASKERRSCESIILYSFLLALLCSCNSVDRNPEAESVPTPITASQNSEAESGVRDQAKWIKFKGVRVETNIPIVTDIAGSEEPALLLETETDKPDEVWSRHISLKLNGEYAKQHTKSFFNPE